MSKLGKKVLGIMLAASLAITSAFPMQGVAAEKNGSEYQGAEDEDSMPAEEGQTLEELVQPTGEAAEGQPEAEEGQQPTGEAAELVAAVVQELQYVLLDEFLAGQPSGNACEVAVQGGVALLKGHDASSPLFSFSSPSPSALSMGEMAENILRIPSS